MAQATTNPKIEELRFRLKTDPRSRLFYQLAEELRKAGHVDESEQVLRSGLSVYPTYLAAWVSLGRVLREQKNDAGAVEALNRAMQLDPGNVVAARLLADAYRNLGDNIEAIKKYKLVHALMPGDEELKGTIETLERAIRHALEPELESEREVDETPAGEAEASAQAVAPAETSVPADEDPARADDAAAVSVAGTAVLPDEGSLFDQTTPPFEQGGAIATGDLEPMLAAHDESPFEEPVEHSTAAAIEIEAPSGFHIDAAPLSAEVPTPLVPADDEADIFAPAAPQNDGPTEEPTNTLTMADLYVRQGLVNDARHIYENILARDPSNLDVRAKMDAIAPQVNPRIEKLERWLARVSRKEVGRV